MYLSRRLICRALLAGACVAGAAHPAQPVEASLQSVSVLMLWSAAAAGLAWSLRGAGSSLPAWILALGLGLRVLQVLQPPLFSDDLYRYLWEGRVLAEGLSPFQHSPDDPRLLELRDEHWEQVNHRTVSTLYPPLALGLFWLSALLELSPQGWKALVALADWCLLWLIAREVRARGGGCWAPAFYAVHPLPVLESAGSGHLESLAMLACVCGLSLARRRRIELAALSFMAGAALKLLPGVVLLSLCWTQRGRTAVLVATLVTAASLALLLGAEGWALLRGAQRYAESWAFNASLFHGLSWISGDPLRARWLGLALGLGLWGWGWWRLREPCAWLLWLALCLVLLSPVVHPWYILWILVPALCLGFWPGAVLASTAPLAYWVWSSYDSQSGSWQESPWVPWVEYGIFALSLWWWHRQPWRPWGSALTLEETASSSRFQTSPAASTTSKPSGH